MPLDGHAHLIAQGWSGKGTGLRHDAITKPVTVIQKKTLAGIGKDRDEAFPFWDHVFQAASVSIQVKVHDSDEESDSDESSAPAVTLKRTSTGILSNQRPVAGTPALSGTTTPSDDQASGSGSVTPRLSIMAAAKQQAARRMLYSMFYRGPVLSTEDVPNEVVNGAQSFSSSPKTADEEEVRIESKKYRKRKMNEEQEAKPERKRQKREAKDERMKGKKRMAKEKERADASSEDDPDEVGQQEEVGESGEFSTATAEKALRKVARAEKKRRKEEKRARKEERRKRNAERRTKTDKASTGSDPSQPSEKSVAPTRTSSEAHTKMVNAADLLPVAEGTKERTNDSDTKRLKKRSKS